MNTNSSNSKIGTSVRKYRKIQREKERIERVKEENKTNIRDANYVQTLKRSNKNNNNYL